MVERRRREASEATPLDVVTLLPQRVDSPGEVAAASGACDDAAPQSDVPATTPAAEPELPLAKRRMNVVPERCRNAGAGSKHSAGLQLAGGQQVAGADRERCPWLASLAHAERSAGMHPASMTSRPASSLLPSPGTGESASQFSATQASCCSCPSRAASLLALCRWCSADDDLPMMLARRPTRTSSRDAAAPPARDAVLRRVSERSVRLLQREARDC